MSNESPWANGPETSVTLKGGKDFDAPWIVFRGTPEQVKQQLAQAFQMDADEAEALTLVAVATNAATEFHGLYSAAKGLDAKATSSRGGTRPRSNPAAWNKGEQEKAEEKPAEPEKTPKEIALAQIAAISSTGELKRWWAEDNKGANIFGAESEVQAAWKSRGKALQAEGK